MKTDDKGAKKPDGTDGQGRLGPYRLGRSHEMGPGLGRVYEAWDVETGGTSLVMVPGEQVNWRPSGAWKVRLSYDPTLRALLLEILESPAEFDLSELVNMLVMVSAAMERLEEDPHIQAHLSLAPGNQELSQAARRLRPSLRAPRARRLAPSRVATLVGLALCGVALGLGLWLRLAGRHEHPETGSSELTVQEQTPTSALHQVDTRVPGGPAIANPMPEKPFENQMQAPCYPDLGEVEINGGCWVELARRAPCAKIQSEYKGKCYLSVVKRKEPVPNTMQQ